MPSLKADILKAYPSIHAFCKAHPSIPRSSVYLALSGRYPGNASKQEARIRQALATPGPAPALQPVPSLSPADVTLALQEIRCSHCRRLDKRECFTCRSQTEKEGKELFSKIFDIQGGEG